MIASDHRNLCEICVKGQCLPGNCNDFFGEPHCLCPEGFISQFGTCTAIQCLIPHLCRPGICIVKNNKETCLCPKRYIALGGICKYMGNCHDIDCKPGFCIVENETEKCYCPTGFTDKNNSCIEITFKNSSWVTTTMLMIIVAGSSIILSTFFGFCICYCHSKRNEIQYE